MKSFRVFCEIPRPTGVEMPSRSPAIRSISAVLAKLRSNVISLTAASATITSLSSFRSARAEGDPKLPIRCGRLCSAVVRYSPPWSAETAIRMFDAVLSIARAVTVPSIEERSTGSSTRAESGSPRTTWIWRASDANRTPAVASAFRTIRSAPRIAPSIGSMSFVSPRCLSKWARRSSDADTAKAKSPRGEKATAATGNGNATASPRTDDPGIPFTARIACLAPSNA